jgi:hypothetical protein
MSINNKITEIDSSYSLDTVHIHMDIYYDIECCICLNTFDYEFIITNCCKKNIHKICLMDWILSDYNININCSMCRQEVKNVKEMISYVELKQHISSIIQKEYSKSDLEGVSFINIHHKQEKMIEIINKLYICNIREDDILSIFCRTALVSIYFLFVLFLIYMAINISRNR